MYEKKPKPLNVCFSCGHSLAPFVRKHQDEFEPEPRLGKIPEYFCINLECKFSKHILPGNWVLYEK